MNTRFMRKALLPLFALLSLLSQGRAQESVYLQSGEEFQGKVVCTTDSTLAFAARGETRAFPLADVQRIEFQRPREFDGLDTPEALSQASPLFAEALAVKTEDLKRKYPQAGLVHLRADVVVTASPGGAYTLETAGAWRICEQRSSDSAFQAVYFLPGITEPSIVYGITVGPDGKVSRVSDSASKIEAVYPSIPEYNFERRLKFTLKGAQPGATLFLKTRLTGVARDLLPLAMEYAFWRTEPALERSVTFVGGAARDVAVAVEGGLKAEDGSLVWRLKDVPQVMPEPLMPPLEAFAPTLVMAFPGASWSALAKEYYGAVGVSAIPSSDKTTARQLYDKVRRDVRLVNVPMSALPKPPAAPAEILKRGFGTSVEKALLLEALLKGIGADAETVIVRGRRSGPLVASVPRMSDFNYGVVKLTDSSGAVTWLEPDALFRAWSELDDNVQGADGLDLAAGEIVAVPARAADAEGTMRRVDVALAADGSALVRDSYSFRGGDAFALRPLANMTVDELRKWAANFVGRDLPGVELVEFTHSDFSKVSEEETLSFTYRVPALAQVAGNFLVLRLPNARYSPADVGRSTRQFDLFWLARESADVVFTVNAPDGFAAYAIGSNVKAEGNGWTFAAGFSKDADGRRITFDEKWRRDALDAPRSEYAPLRQALIRRGILRNEMLVFEKKGG